MESDSISCSSTALIFLCFLCYAVLVITNTAMLSYNLFAGVHGYFMKDARGTDSKGAYNYNIALLFW